MVDRNVPAIIDNGHIIASVNDRFGRMNSRPFGIGWPHLALSVLFPMGRLVPLGRFNVTGQEPSAR
jgi:hypothetical protein